MLTWGSDGAVGYGKEAFLSSSSLQVREQSVIVVRVHREGGREAITSAYPGPTEKQLSVRSPLLRGASMV